jgi:hypothetical protein
LRLIPFWFLCLQRLQVKILLRHVQAAAFIGAMRVSDGDVLRTFASFIGLSNTTGVKTLAYSCLGHMDAIAHIQVSTGVVGALLLALCGSLIVREVRRRYFPTGEDAMQLKVVEPGDFLRTLFCCCLSDDQRYMADGSDELADETVDGHNLARSSLSGQSADKDGQRSRGGSLVLDSRSLGLGSAPLRFKRWSYEQTLAPASVILLLFFYPALMLENLAFMRSCLSLNGEHYMVEDTSISCTSSTFRVWYAVALVRVIVVGLGVPLFILLRIARFQRRIRQEAEEQATIIAATISAGKPVPVHEPFRARGTRSFFLRYRFLFEGYRETEWFW